MMTNNKTEKRVAYIVLEVNQPVVWVETPNENNVEASALKPQQAQMKMCHE